MQAGRDASDILKEGIGSEQPTRYPVAGRRCMVVTSQPLATLTGIEVLRNGGNAFDAAIAVSAVLCVVEPYSSHLGGDAFALIYRPGMAEPEALNASGPAPKNLGILPERDGIPQRGASAVTVPGLVAAWEAIYSRYTTMPLERLLARAMEYAAEGFPVGYRLSTAISNSSESLSNFPSWAQTFMPQGRPLKPGTLLRQDDLSRTLRRLATAGLRDFYEGQIAKLLIEAVGKLGGYLTEIDLGGCRAEWLRPLRTTYRNYTVYAQPPVSQGHILLEELNIVEGFPLSEWGFASLSSVHAMVEAKKIAFADRDRWSGDPRMVEVPLGEILSKGSAAQKRDLIRLDRALVDVPQITPAREQDTTSFAVADAEGNLVAFIQSIFHPFGAGIVVDGLGILLNNRLFAFSADPRSPNYLLPGKRPVHTLNTYMAFKENSPFAFGGSPGGEYQVQTNFQVLVNLIDFGMDPQAAVDAPRWGHDATGLLHLESRFPPDIAEGLRRLGHRVNTIAGWGNASRAFLISKYGNTYWGAVDSRSDGIALGW